MPSLESRALLVFKSSLVLVALILVGVSHGADSYCSAMKSWINQVSQDSDWVEITAWSGLKMDLRYATHNNFVQTNLYCNNPRIFLHRLAAGKLHLTLQWLKKKSPQTNLLIWDAARPLYAQEALRAKVRGTPLAPYVSSPKPGSLHNYGMAIDLTLCDAQGHALDMGSDFDDFTVLASSVERVEDSLLQSGALQSHQIKNRRLLRQAMRHGGWMPLPSEWWHFNAASSAWVRDSLGVGAPR